MSIHLVAGSQGATGSAADGAATNGAANYVLVSLSASDAGWQYCGLRVARLLPGVTMALSHE